MPTHERQANEFNRRSRRYFRRLVLAKDEQGKHKLVPNPDYQQAKAGTNSPVMNQPPLIWLLVLGALVVFTFICLLASIVIMRTLLGT